MIYIKIKNSQSKREYISFILEKTIYTQNNIKISWSIIDIVFFEVIINTSMEVESE